MSILQFRIVLLKISIIFLNFFHSFSLNLSLSHFVSDMMWLCDPVFPSTPQLEPTTTTTTTTTKTMDSGNGQRAMASLMRVEK